MRRRTVGMRSAIAAERARPKLRTRRRPVARLIYPLKNRNYRRGTIDAEVIDPFQTLHQRQRREVRAATEIQNSSHPMAPDLSDDGFRKATRANSAEPCKIVPERLCGIVELARATRHRGVSRLSGVSR